MARQAPSLIRLTAEIDAIFPHRDLWSEGWLGDDSHATRFSDHNPDAAGWVHAHDFDATLRHEMGPGPVGDYLIAHLLRLARSGKWHPINYLIYKGVIYSRSVGFRGRAYTGTNSHHSHVHVSIMRTDAARFWRGTWLEDTRAIVDLSNVQRAFKEAPDSAPRSIRRVQERLVAWGWLKKPYRHGHVGFKTRRAMKGFCRKHGFEVRRVPGKPALRKLIGNKYRVRD